MLEFIEKKIDHLRYPYLVVVVLTHVLYFVAVFGIIQIKQEYIHWLSVAIQTFIALFLLVRFHPFRKRLAEIREVDNTVVFGSAMLLATNLLTVEYAKWVNPIIDQYIHIPASK
jgi:hypothetical protein